MKPFGAERTLAERKWPELSEEEERLYHIVVPGNRAQAIDLDGFVDLYGAETVARDKKRVAELEAIFRKENTDIEAQNWTKRGELFESIINDQIEASNWLGERASVFVASRYDDIVNGVDSIVEFEQGVAARSHLALAVDITKSSKQIDKKLEMARISIERGRLAKVKYFSSTDMRGELREVPRVIIGADEDAMQEIAELLLLFKTRQKYPNAGKPNEFKVARERLQNHKLQFQILFEIRAQLEAFVRYAKKLGKVGPAEKCQEVLETIADVLKEKTESLNYNPGDLDLLPEDKVYKMILERSESFGK